MDNDYKTDVPNDIVMIEEMRRYKKEYGYSYEEIAKRSGLPLGTVQKVLGGFTKKPRHATLAALAGVLLPENTDFPLGRGLHVHNDPGSNKETAGPGTCAGIIREGYSGGDTYSDLLQEGAPAYVTGSPYNAGGNNKPVDPKKNTIKYRDSFPEDHPSELIDGVIYNMSSPSAQHQMFCGAVYNQLCNYIDSHGGDCIPFIAPTDVRLDRDDYTMLVPDVFVICNPGDHLSGGGRFIDGAPDLVVEVLSAATRRKDMFVKQEKYRNAGVQEYWIVDPQKEKVIVYLFGEEPDVGLYGFDSKIPVGIYGGDCEIDFTDIVRKLGVLKKVFGRNE